MDLAARIVNNLGLHWKLGLAPGTNAFSEAAAIVRGMLVGEGEGAAVSAESTDVEAIPLRSGAKDAPTAPSLAPATLTRAEVRVVRAFLRAFPRAAQEGSPDV